MAAISIPITFSFNPDVRKEGDSSRGFYSYSFAANDASRYTYNDGYSITVVEINNGTAEAVWQFYTVDIPGYEPTTLGGAKPDGMEKMFHDFITIPMENGDIIQSIPDSGE